MEVIGGDFTAVGGLPRRNAAAILPDGSVDPDFAPDPDGVVQALAGSADGSIVYIGGSFATVGGLARSNLAALEASTGSARPDWAADTDGDVLTLVTSGDRLYAGGRFREIGGVLRRRLASLDQATAAVDLAFHPWPNWTVKEVEVSADGSRVYAVGGFTAIGGQSRRGAAELLSDSGLATPFDPASGGVALASGLTPDGSRFFFSTTDNHLYAYDPAVSDQPVYSVKTSGDTQAIVANDTEVYFGGHFGQVWNEKVWKDRRLAAASLNVADGTLTSWNPGVRGRMGPWAMELTGSHLLMGGEITHVGGVRQQGFARFTVLP